MAIISFFLIGLALLLALPVNAVALIWSEHGTLKFILNMLTHMFAHANLDHLLGNYIFVFPYALYLEYKVGFKRFCKIWLLAGFGALAADILVVYLGQPQSGVVGSSGAAFGICAAALYLMDGPKLVQLFAKALMLWFIVQQAYLAVLAFQYPMFFSVAFAAHLGGLIAGCLLAFFEKRRLASLRPGQGASK